MAKIKEINGVNKEASGNNKIEAVEDKIDDRFRRRRKSQ